MITSTLKFRRINFNLNKYSKTDFPHLNNDFQEGTFQKLIFIISGIVQWVVCRGCTCIQNDSKGNSIWDKAIKSHPPISYFQSICFLFFPSCPVKGAYIAAELKARPATGEKRDRPLIALFIKISKGPVNWIGIFAWPGTGLRADFMCWELYGDKFNVCQECFCLLLGAEDVYCLRWQTPTFTHSVLWHSGTYAPH